MPRRKRPVSPANYDLDDDDFDDECGGSNRNLPGQRNAANARERARMRILSSAFCRLKTKLPWVPPDTKLSKLDTLKLATTYIQQLGALLAGETEMVDNSMPQNLTWPFHFQQPPDQTKINPSDRSKNTASTTIPSPTSTSPSSSSSSSSSSLSSSSSTNLTTGSPSALETTSLSPNTQLAGLNLDNQWLGHHTGNHHPHHQLHNHPHHHHHHLHHHHNHSSHHQSTILNDCNFRETNSSCFNSILHGQ